MGPTGRRPDSDNTPRLKTSPACCPRAIFADVLLHTYTDKYTPILFIEAAAPVAREKQWTTVSRVIVCVVYTSGQSLGSHKETAFSCDRSNALLVLFGELRLDDRVPISCLLLPHAAALDTEETAWTELNATLGDIDKDSFNFRSAAVQRVHLHRRGCNSGTHKHSCTWSESKSAQSP